MTSVAEKVINWVNDNFKDVMANRAPGVQADIIHRFIVMSHSAGGHVMTEYLNSTCGNVKMQIMLDPVDGADPFGIKKDFITTPGVMLPYATPVLVLATELDQAHKEMVPACAPNNISNLRFYNAMSGPKWFLNVSKYGHVDFYNAEYRDLSKVMCETCRKNCDFSEYKNLVKEAILNFIDGVLNGSPLALDIIENARFTIPAEHKHDYMLYTL
jgi:chlorophyllase